MTRRHGLGTHNRQMRPRHYTDTDLWKVWAENPDEVVEHGGIYFKWTVAKVAVPKSNNSYHYAGYTPPTHQLEVTKYFSRDGGNSWEEDTVTPSWSWRVNDNLSGVAKLLDDAISKSKKEWTKARNRENARRRAAKLKKEAEELGITVTELRRRKSEERKKQNPHNVSKKDLEALRRKMEVGPILKDLQDEANLVMEKLNNDNVHLIHVKRYKRKLEEAVNILREWQK